MSDYVAILKRDWDPMRRAVLCEPRGHEAIVGALVVESEVADFGVVFFNNSSYLGMCGHGTIGVVKSLSYLNRVSSDTVKFETIEGIVTAKIEPDGSVTIENVPANRYLSEVRVGDVVGDVAYGGNWFFLTNSFKGELHLSNLEEMMHYSTNLMDELWQNGITGENGAKIDHIELFGKPIGDADSRNFVLCPGKQYDRSPCGTGTSAKLACLHADGKIAIGQIWKQESITGSQFSAWFNERDGELRPYINGTAFVIAESSLVFEQGDPFIGGIDLC
jgi:4-hydroxyproline epimerase